MHMHIELPDRGACPSTVVADRLPQAIQTSFGRSTRRKRGEMAGADTATRTSPGPELAAS